MTEKLDIFKCSVCGNIVEVIIPGEGELVCCGEDMKLLEAKTHDLGEEKHIPDITSDEDGEITVAIGSMPHPMTNEHHIQFIEVVSKDKNWVKRKYLHPDEQPEMKFKCKCQDGFRAIEHCNIHGLWGKDFEGEK